MSYLDNNIIEKLFIGKLSKYYPDFEYVKVSKDKEFIEVEYIKKKVIEENKFLGMVYKRKYEIDRIYEKLYFSTKLQSEIFWINEKFTVQYVISEDESIIYWKVVKYGNW